MVGRIINGYNDLPFALPILKDEQQRLFIDAALFGEDDLQRLFSFARADFMVDMEVPSAYVQFLRALMPRKPRSELYSQLGLHKQGKTLFYRDFQSHLRHSSDHFRIAPGIKGMVMLVFDLPSYPFVFKVIKDYYPPQKDTTPGAGQAASTCWSSSTTGSGAWPTRWSSATSRFRARASRDELIAEIQKLRPASSRSPTATATATRR